MSLQDNLSDTDEQPVDFNRQFASRVLLRIDHHQSFAADQIGNWSRWLCASLLAVNGAGILAAASPKYGIPDALAATIFAFGLAFALISGAFLQDAYNEVPDHLLEQDNYWTAVSVSGLRDADREEVFRLWNLSWKRIAAPACGGLPACCSFRVQSSLPFIRRPMKAPQRSDA